MDADPKEFELKLELPEDEIKRVAESAALTKMAQGPAAEKRLLSTYFDTADHRLAAAGASLRIREMNGERVQTAKLGTAVSGGVSNPVESETPTLRTRPHPGAIANEKLRRKFIRLVDFNKLKPVFRTEIARRAFQLVAPGVEAELSFDEGRIVAGRRSRPISEVELERISGGIEAYADVALNLFGDIHFHLATQSKAAAGYALIGKKPKPAREVGASSPRLAPGDDSISTFASVCQSACDQILGNWFLLGKHENAEIAHQLRVGLRRLRTALRIFRPEFDNQTLRDLAAELREVQRIVGDLRNADVIASDIVAPTLGRNANARVARQLVQLLELRCTGERKAVSARLASARNTRLALRIALLPHGAGWSAEPASNRTAADIAQSALHKHWKKVRKQARNLDRLSDTERHALRKDLKTLRYALEFFASILPNAKYARFLGRLKVLQDSFGYLNDVVLARSLPDLLDDDMRTDPAMQHLVGFVLGWHEGLGTREWAKAKKRWEQIEKLPLPWDP